MFDDRIGNLQKMLARMGPEGRQRYAAEHADDPIAVSMALFVNNIAKEIKEGKRGEPEVQTPVVQQAIQAMNQPRMPQGMPPQGMPPQGQPQAPQGQPQAMPQQQAPQGQPQMAANGGYMDSRLPEDMGIGALPERSLSNMADGGIVGYAEKGLVQPRKTNVGPYEAQIRAEALRQKVNPDLMVRMFSTESSGNPNAVSPKGATGVGQLMPDAAKEMGLTLKERFDPNKNIPASVGYFKKQLAAFGGDPEKAAAAYNWGPGNLEKHLVKNQKDQKDWKIGLPKETANYLTELMPVGTAQAGDATPATAAAPATKSATTADLQALRQSKESFGDKLETAGQVARSLIQNPLAQVASGFAGLAGSVSPGPEGQGADYVKRTQDYLGYNPEYKEESKKILGALGYPLEALRKYAADPAGEYLAEQGFPAIGATAKGAIEAAPAALGFLGRGAKASATPAATTKAAPGAAAPTPGAPAPGAGTVIPPVKQKGLTQAQKNAASTAVPVPAAGAATTGRSGLTQGQINAAAGAPPLMGPPRPTPAQLAAQQKQAAGLQAIANQKQAAAALTGPPKPTPAQVAAQQAAADSFVGPLRPNPAQVAARQGAGLGALAAGAPKPAGAATAPKPAGAATAPKPAGAATAPKPAGAATAPKPAGAAGAPKPAVVAAEEGAAARPAVVAAERPPAGRPAAVAAGEGAVAGAESRMAAVRAATGEGRQSSLALLPAALAAGAGTGSGASSAPAATPFFDRTSGDDTRGFPEIPPPLKLTPEVKQEAVALAKAEIPKEERSGFGYEDLLMFGLNLMAGQSSNALTNVGTAGIAALTAKQARTAAEKKTAMEERKIASDEKKENAMAKYYEKYGNYLEAEGSRKAEEDKPLAQLNKEIAAAYMELNKDLMLRSDPVKMAAAKRQARAELIANYPDLASTMGGAGPSLDLTKWGNPVKN